MSTDRRTALLALAERVEREGASRELDAAIAVASGAVPADTKFWNDPHFAGRYHAGEDGIVEVRRYTASLDAADELVDAAVKRIGRPCVATLVTSRNRDGVVRATHRLDFGDIDVVGIATGANAAPRAVASAALRALAEGVGQ